MGASLTINENGVATGGSKGAFWSHRKEREVNPAAPKGGKVDVYDIVSAATGDKIAVVFKTNVKGAMFYCATVAEKEGYGRNRRTMADMIVDLSATL